MPEIVTKHPDVVKQVLESAGAKCGAGEPQKILTRCPRESFCALPGGEICIYGVDGVDRMTQLSRADLCRPRADAPPPPEGTGVTTASSLGSAAILPAAVLAAFVLRSRRRRGG